MSNDGTLLVTFSHDQSMKIFDVVNFDMMHMLQLPFVPAAAEWVYRVRSPSPKASWAATMMIGAVQHARGGLLLPSDLAFHKLTC